jgi:hypothetical protein
VIVATPGIWGIAGTFADGDNVEPAVGMRFVELRSNGQNETEIKTDLYAAWHHTTDREDQVVAKVLRHGYGGPYAWEDLHPQFFGESVRTASTSISDTVGYAAKPDIAISDNHVFLTWMDDGVRDGDGLSSVFVMSATRDERVLHERLSGDASGKGISQTGGALQSLSIVVAPTGSNNDAPYVVWTEAQPGMPQVYVRHDSIGSQNQVLIQPTGSSTIVAEGSRTDTYSVVLAGQPSANVTVMLHLDSQLIVSPVSLVFTPSNWFIARTVTIQAVDDTLVENRQLGRIRHTVFSEDPAFHALPIASIDVIIHDNDRQVVAEPRRKLGGKNSKPHFNVS